jgi:diguanylate cyclase (GGDEF)-like protein
MCILSYKTGWIFFVNINNQYTRGKLFLLPTIISLFYFILLVVTVAKNSVEYEDDDKKVLFTLLIIPVLGIIIQILFKDVLLIWISTSVSLLLYYIFLRELQFKYDIQTGIRNRSAFEKEMEKFLREDKNASIVMVDLNNLKKINDKYGHKAGDEIIKCAAKIIEDNFTGVGKTFRIGGDEFCVICWDTKKDLLDSALSNLDRLLFIVNQKRDIKIVLAYGYALYTREESEDIYSTFVKADKAMYTHKAKLKGLYGRRSDDEQKK